MNQQDPPAYLFHLRIDEPLTVLTDLILAAVCIIAYLKLRTKEKLHPAVKLMNKYFLFLAIGTFLGGILGHAFYYLLSPRWRFPGWLAGMLAVVYAELAALTLIKRRLRPGVFRILQWIVYGEMFLLLFPTFFTIDFKWVEAHSIFGLLLVFAGIHLIILSKETGNNKASIFALSGIGVLLFSFVIFALKLDLFVWLPSTILAHLLMAISIWFSYKGTVCYPMTMKESGQE